MSGNRFQEIKEVISLPFNWVKQLVSHPYSCYMLAAVEYNNAMFHIFSGPLFANVEGYVYLDLLIWGISPLIYLLFRQKIYKMMKPDIKTEKIAATDQPDKLIKQIKQHKKHLNFIHKRRLCSLIFFSVAIFVSFLFMNYSQTFNWNYFTRIINMDLGYLIFDFACRSMQLIVEIQEEEQIQEKYTRCHTQFQLEEMKSTALKVQKCRIHCKFKNFTMFLSYAVVFLLFANGFDVSLRYSGQEVLALTSVISCLVTFVIPLLYFFHFKTKYFQKWDIFNKLQAATPYKALQGEEQNNDKNERQQDELEMSMQITDQRGIRTQDEIQKQLRKIKGIICKANKPCSPPTYRLERDQTPNSTWQKIRYVMDSRQLRRPMCIFTSVFFSLIINISYLALWIMETLKHQQNYIQYNETLLISSVFFMIGSGLFAIASQINLNYPFEIDHRDSSKTDSQLWILKPTQWGYYINKIFLFILGVILLLGFTLIKNNIYMFILSAIGLGFHLALLNYVYFKVEKIIQEIDIEIDLEILSLNLQTIAYLVVPAFITVTQTTSMTYSIYGWLSSLSMILAAFIL